MNDIAMKTCISNLRKRADKNCMTYAGRHKDGVGLGTRWILREKADCKQSIKYSILLLMLVVLKLKYSFAVSTSNFV